MQRRTLRISTLRVHLGACPEQHVRNARVSVQAGDREEFRCLYPAHQDGYPGCRLAMCSPRGRRPVQLLRESPHGLPWLHEAGPQDLSVRNGLMEQVTGIARMTHIKRACCWLELWVLDGASVDPGSVHLKKVLGTAGSPPTWFELAPDFGFHADVFSGCTLAHAAVLAADVLTPSAG